MRGEGEVYIDLGEVSELYEPPHPERPKWRPPSVVLAPLLVLLVLAMVATPPPRSHLVRIAGFPGVERGFLLVNGGLVRQDGDQMFLIGLDGRERWRIPWRAGIDDFPQASAVHGLLLMRTMTERGQMQTIALDLASGERRWELPGWLHTVDDVLMAWEEWGLRVYDADGGRLLWESLASRSIGFDTEHRSLYLLDRDQRLAEHDTRTGVIRKSRELMIPVELDQVHIEIGADHVLLTATSSTGLKQEHIFLDRNTLRPITGMDVRWHRRTDCGPVDCVINYGGGIGGGVIDRATGSLLWSVHEGEVVAPWANGTVIVLGYSDWGGEVRALGVVDPLTRRSVFEIEGWTLLPDVEGFSAGFAQITPIALFRSRGRPTLVAQIGGAGIRVLGSVPNEVNSCRYIAPLLQCRASANTIGVWRIDD